MENVAYLHMEERLILHRNSSCSTTFVYTKISSLNIIYFDINGYFSYKTFCYALSAVEKS